MSLLSRAREAQAARQAAGTRLVEGHHKRDREHAARILAGRIEQDVNPDKLRMVVDDGWEGCLWGVTIEGITFVVGMYYESGWNGYVAARPAHWHPVKVKEWPPEHRRSVMNVRWAPKGYTYVGCLADLAVWA